jgi:hypothetical protein
MNIMVFLDMTGVSDESAIYVFKVHSSQNTVCHFPEDHNPNVLCVVDEIFPNEKLPTHEKPMQPIASDSMSPRIDG